MTKKKEVKKPEAKPETPATSGEGELLNVVQETAGAVAGAEPLPKGNVLEAQIGAEPEPEAPKNKGGRPKGSKTKPKPPEPEADRPDVIATTLNGLVLPIVAKRLKRKPEDMMFTKDEQKMLKDLQPPMEWNKPSWPVYIAMTLAIILTHYYTTEEVKAPEASVPTPVAPENPRAVPPPPPVMPEAKIDEHKY